MNILLFEPVMAGEGLFGLLTVYLILIHNIYPASLGEIKHMTMVIGLGIKNKVKVFSSYRTNLIKKL